MRDNIYKWVIGTCTTLLVGGIGLLVQQQIESVRAQQIRDDSLYNEVRQIKYNQELKLKSWTADRMEAILSVELPLIDSLYACIKWDIIDSTSHMSIDVPQANRIINNCITNLTILSRDEYIKNGLYPDEILLINKIESDINEFSYQKQLDEFFVIYKSYKNGHRVKRLATFLDENAIKYRSHFRQKLFKEFKFLLEVK
jgi:hypothetical protein